MSQLGANTKVDFAASAGMAGLSKRDLLAVRAQAGSVSKPSFMGDKLRILDASLAATLQSMERTGEERCRQRELAEFMNEHEVSTVQQNLATLHRVRQRQHGKLRAIADEHRANTKSMHAEIGQNISDQQVGVSESADRLERGRIDEAQNLLSREISDRTAAVSLGLDGVLREVFRLGGVLRETAASRAGEMEELQRRCRRRIGELDERLATETRAMQTAVRTVGNMSDDEFDLLGERIGGDERNFQSRLKTLSRSIHDELLERNKHASDTVNVTSTFLKDLEKNVRLDTCNINTHLAKDTSFF